MTLLNPSADVVEIVYRPERTALAEMVMMTNSLRDRGCDFFSGVDSSSETGSMSVLYAGNATCFKSNSFSEIRTTKSGSSP
jgi:hypothetical protein